MTHLLTRNSWSRKTWSTSSSTGEKRLARTPSDGEFRQEGGLQSIATPISQETLAEIVGTTRPRVNHFE
jgi:hypothetical protein